MANNNPSNITQINNIILMGTVDCTEYPVFGSFEVPQTVELESITVTK